MHDPDKHDSVIIHLEPDILECEVKWALGSITTNKASGGDGIPVELFQILKDDAIKVLYFSRKTSTSTLLTTPKPLIVWITTNFGKFFKTWEYQATLPAFWEICMQVKKQQLLELDMELDMEQQTGSKLGKEYIKAVYCRLAYLTYMQSQFSSVQSPSHVWLFATPWTAAPQASLSITDSQSLLKFMSIESVIPSNHLILCHPLLLLHSIFSSIRVFSNESVLCVRW